MDTINIDACPNFICFFKYIYIFFNCNNSFVPTNMNSKGLFLILERPLVFLKGDDVFLICVTAMLLTSPPIGGSASVL